MVPWPRIGTALTLLALKCLQTAVCWRLDTGGNLATDEEVNTTKGCAGAAAVWAKSRVYECFLGVDRAVGLQVSGNPPSSLGGLWCGARCAVCDG